MTTANNFSRIKIGPVPWLNLVIPFVLLMTSAALVPAAAASAQPNAAIAPNDLSITYAFFPVATNNINRPIFVTYADNSDARLFIVEQGGLIKIWQNDQVLDTPFLDVSNSIVCCGERGLLGLAFEPNYAQTGRFYVYYTNPAGDLIIARYTVSADRNIANSTGQVLLSIPHPDEGNHNGGWLGFGKDNLLYIGIGDGGYGGNGAGQSANNPNNPNRCSAQKTDNRTGKILRLNVVGQSSYTSPITNSFASGQAPEVWAIGVRNPWRNSFDRQTGDLYIADVGQGEYEEVTLLPKDSVSGANLGWPLREGSHDYGNEFNCVDSGLPRTEPFVDYNHSVGKSITGGYVYRGQRYPVINGVYFYGDFSSGRLWAAWQPSPTATLQTAEIKQTDFNIASFGEDANGELYLVNYGNDKTEAGIYRLQALTNLTQKLYLPLTRR